MNHFSHIAGLITAMLLLSSCTWVKLTPEGENVAVLAPDEVSSCTRTGTTTVEVMDKAIVDRNPEKVALELRTLARNRAADRGDIIVPATQVRDGEQMFVIYRCRN